MVVWATKSVLFREVFLIQGKDIPGVVDTKTVSCSDVSLYISVKLRKKDVGLLALEVLYAAKTLELSIHHDGQSSTQCLTLLHTERERMIHTPVERERESAHL